MTHSGDSPSLALLLWFPLLTVGLGDMEKIKYHDIFHQIPRYRYRNDIVVLTNGAFTKYLHNEISDK